VALFAAAARLPVLTPDVWWHLATGRWIATSGIPHQDPFSYTLAGRAWMVHEWLADVGLHALHTGTGLLGLVLVRALLLVAGFAVAYRAARLHAPTLLALAPIAAAAWASQRNWLDRPQLWSFVLAPLAVLLLERDRRGGGRVAWLLPFVFALWVNLHGAFMLGLALVMGWAAASAWTARRGGAVEQRAARRLFVVAGLCVAATLVNPNGLDGALYPLRYVGSGLRHTIQEERPGALQGPYAAVHFALLAALVATLMLRGRRTPAPHAVAALVLAWLSMPRLGGLALPLAAERHAPLLLFAGTPILAWQLAALAGEGGRRRAARWGDAGRTAPAWTAALVLLAFALWQGARSLPRDGSPEARLLPGRFPAAAADWLATQRLPGPLVNPYRWGGYLLWRLWPEYSVWIDSRGDLYGADRLQEDELLYRMPPGAEAAVPRLLERYDANLIVWYFLTLDFGPLQVHPLTRWLLSREDWRLVFLDGPDPRRPRAPSATTAVFLRVHPRNAALLDRLPPVRLPAGLPGGGARRPPR
jgi:hypothetical protein